MTQLKKLSTIPVHWKWLFPLAVVKLLLHFYTNTITSYGLHRDEYLYLAEGDHLDWGYMEVPPMIAMIGKIARLLMGDTIFAARFFPALIGAVTILLIGIMVRDMGGKKWAQFIAGFGFLVSPVFLGSNNLFQPVSFNQFCWFLTAFLMVKLIRYQQPKLWYWLGVVAGLGFLTKYSIVFFLVALVGGLLLTPHRKWLGTKYPWLGLAIALAIASPNLWWQYTHGFPVWRHMEELATTQLVNVSTATFLIPQFLDHFATTLIWFSGLVFLFSANKLKKYRILGWTYLLVLFLLWAMSGKDYYTFGAYSMLFAAGGIALEAWWGKKALLLLPVVLVLNLFAIPFALPILPIEMMKAYGVHLRDNYGMEGPLRWEDGIVRDLRQDYADMHGWEEIPIKVAKLYHSFTPEEKEKCLLYAGHYGQAGVLNFYRKKYNLPETYSFNASFVAWLKEDMDIERQIQVDDTPQTTSESFKTIELIDSIESPYARDPGLIYLKTQPKMELKEVWKELVRERKREAGYRVE